MARFILSAVLLCLALQAGGQDADPATPAPLAPPAPLETYAPDLAAPATPAEVLRRIAEAGATTPPWWESTPLEVPPKLDISGKNHVKGWRPDVNLGAHIWQNVNMRPANWRKGVRLLHHVVEQRAGDARGQADAMGMLAMGYYRLLGDWARAAYWLDRKQKAGASLNPPEFLALAECYWRLGSKPLALSTMRKAGLDARRSSGAAVELLAAMGEQDKALAAARLLAGSPRRADEGLVAAGKVYRRAGELARAAEFYAQVGKLTSGTRYLKIYQARAADSLDAVRLLSRIDLARVPDGSYRGSASGYKGPLEVSVSVAGGKITAVEVTSHREDQPYANMTEIPRRIVTNGDLRFVDAVTGASTTSDAILNAATRAVAGAAK